MRTMKSTALKNCYAIGDVQGCHNSLAKLIARLPKAAKIICVGDLVNRGPDSLKTLRLLKRMQEEGRAECVLGNHDLHLLARDAGIRGSKSLDTLEDVLRAKDRAELIDWLRRRPLALYSGRERGNTLIVHAGVLPQWDAEKTLALAHEVEAALRGRDYRRHLRQMYGNEPSAWSDSLRGADRLRAIINALTRLRFCTPEGVMDFDTKEGLASAPAGYMPWFRVPNRKTQGVRVVFGHWSTLGLVQKKNVIGLDTGCVWGGSLTAVDLASQRVIQVRA